MSNREFKKSR